MKSTGIVRNIDELGRIVIPKEMRKKMDIASSDPIEIYVEDDKIILQKCKNVCKPDVCDHKKSYLHSWFL